MTKLSARSEAIRQHILKNIDQSQIDIKKSTAEKFAISRQAVHKHLKRLVDEEFLVVKGKTKGRTPTYSTRLVPVLPNQPGISRRCRMAK